MDRIDDFVKRLTETRESAPVVSVQPVPPAADSPSALFSELLALADAGHIERVLVFIEGPQERAWHAYPEFRGTINVNDCRWYIGPLRTEPKGPGDAA